MRMLFFSLVSLSICSGCSTTYCESEHSKDTIWGAKTLFAWQHKNKDDADDKKGDDERKKENDKEKADEADVISTDRPDFTESSKTVGKGRIQLESGYTYSRNRQSDVQNQHSFPEALFRIGLWADWLELRIGQNYSSTQYSTSSVSGLDDLYLGFKLGFTEQKEFLPETALILQTTVPTGPPGLTAGKTLPGINYLFGWDVIPDLLTAGGSFQFDVAATERGQTYLEVAQSFTVGYAITEKLNSYLEVYGIEPCGAREPDVGPVYYLNGGFSYKFTPNFQYDIRAGVGLNKQSDDFFVGSGFAVRY